MVKKIDLCSNTRQFDLFAGHLLSLYIVLYMLNNVLALFIFTSSYNHIIAGINAGVFWLYLLWNQNIIGYTWKRIILVYTVMFCLYMVSAVFYDNLSPDLYQRMFWTFVYCVPLGCIWYDVKHIDNALYMIDKGALAITIMAVFFGIGANFDFVIMPKGYSMGLGFAMLIALVYHLMMVNYHKSYILLCIIDFFSIFIYGSRAPILWGVIYMIFLLGHHYKITAKVASKSVLVLGVIIVFFKDIVGFLMSVCSAIGMHSRTLVYLMDHTFYTGRNLNWEGAIVDIQDKCITGWGLGYNTLSVMGLQAHNFVLEVVLQYGIIIGSFMLLCLLICLVNSIKKSSSRETDVIVLFLVAGFLPLLLSSSYLVWPLFWVFAGICLKYKFTIVS